MSQVVALAEADETCGTKAATLGRLQRAGVHVPNGVVVRSPAKAGWQGPLLARLGTGPFAVRSSTHVEDGKEASFAGQLLTLLDVERRELPAAVLAVEQSTRAGWVGAYATGHGQPPPTSCPVLVQDMICPRTGGVLFTADAATIIEGVTGSGQPVVDGTASPERWIVDARPRRVQRAGDGSSVLTVDEVQQVADVAGQVVEVLGGNQDIEWAIVGDDIVVLQSRPITAASPPADAPRGAAAPGGLSGTPASPGIGRGPIRMVGSLDDLPHVANGDVLICRCTSPAWTPALLRAAAVITEVGGMLSHAAIVAREFGIPAVVAVPDAMTKLPDGSTVQVDGTTGVITPLEPTSGVS